VADYERDQAMLVCCAGTCERMDTLRCERILAGAGAFPSSWVCNGESVGPLAPVGLVAPLREDD
jgi:hypothetical protein